MRVYLASTICNTGKFTSEILSTSNVADPLYNSSLPSGPFVRYAGKQHRVQLSHGRGVAALDIGDDFQDGERQRFQCRRRQVGIRKQKRLGGNMARFDFHNTLYLTRPVPDQLDTMGEFFSETPDFPAHYESIFRRDVHGIGVTIDLSFVHAQDLPYILRRKGRRWY